MGGSDETKSREPDLTRHAYDASTGWTLVSLGSYLPVHSLRASLVVLSPTDNGTERV